MHKSTVSHSFEVYALVESVTLATSTPLNLEVVQCQLPYGEKKGLYY